MMEIITAQTMVQQTQIVLIIIQMVGRVKVQPIRITTLAKHLHIQMVERIMTQLIIQHLMRRMVKIQTTVG